MPDGRVERSLPELCGGCGCAGRCSQQQLHHFSAGRTLLAGTVERSRAADCDGCGGARRSCKQQLHHFWACGGPHTLACHVQRGFGISSRSRTRARRCSKQQLNHRWAATLAGQVERQVTVRIPHRRRLWADSQQCFHLIPVPSRGCTVQRCLPLAVPTHATPAVEAPPEPRHGLVCRQRWGLGLRSRGVCMGTLRDFISIKAMGRKLSDALPPAQVLLASPRRRSLSAH